MEVAEVRRIAVSLLENIKKVIIGKDDVIEKLLIAFLASGHVLLEDMPGTGKTTLAKALAASIDCTYARVQFTPDLLPSDLTGVHYYSQKEEKFIFRKGPIFTNVLLADEINRATPRTQSSLLECMEESQVTVDGVTFKLNAPFFVIATQNPLETQGTYQLPEAQMDRFIMKLSVGYPGETAETEMLRRFEQDNPITHLEAVLSKEKLVEAQKAVRNVALSEDLQKYIVALSEASRKHSEVRLGVSPRGSLAVMRAAQVKAAFDGRNFVTPDDVKMVVPPVFSHRILLKHGMSLKNSSGSVKIVEELLSSVPVPVE